MGGGSVLYYCCVCKGGRVLFQYDKASSGKIKDLAALCLEMTPPYHKWYFHTMARKTFGFLTEEDGGDGFTCFAIVDHSISKSRLLRFLRTLKNESRKKMMNAGMPWNTLQKEQLLPIVDRLVASLEHGKDVLPAFNNFTPNHHQAPSSSFNNLEEKKITKDHVVSVRGDRIEMEEVSLFSRFTEVRVANDRETSSAAYPKDFHSSTITSDESQQSLRQQWYRQARIILAINVAVCIILFAVWLAICHGLKCTR